MCNFVVRPIKSYATAEVKVANKTIKRGEVVTVSGVSEEGVSVYMGDTAIGAVIHIPFEVFIHAFTASDEDVKKVKEEESKWFKSK